MLDAFTLKEIEHIKLCLDKQEYAFYIAYLAVLLHERDSEFTSLRKSCDLINDSEVRDFIFEKLSRNNDLEKFVNLVVQFDKKALVTFMMNQKTGADFKLPQEFAILAGKCAELTTDDLLIDVFPRDGEFLIVNYSRCKMREAIGYQISRELYIINKIKAEVLDEDIDFIHHSFLEAQIPQASKYFVVPPFGLKITECENYLIDEICNNHPELENSRTQEILYITKALDNLKENGKIICCLPAGFLSNSGRSEMSFRKWLIDNHYVEACIAFPSDINFQTLSTQLSYLILSKTDKDKFMVVDASKEKHKGARGSYLEYDNVYKIYEALNSESEISKIITYKEVSETYNLNPNYFLAPTEAIDSYGYENVELASIAKIIRGCNSIQKELDDRLSDKVTNVRYLSASWERPNTIPEDLDYLVNIKESEEKYCAMSGDLILSKMGRPKFDVINVRENEKIIVSGNLYIVRFDVTKVLPEFVKCFFEGAGNYLLENALTGSVTPTLSVDMLRKIKIPLIPMEKQVEMVRELKLFESMQKDCYEKLEKIDIHLQTLFDDVMKDKTILYFSEDVDVIL